MGDSRLRTEPFGETSSAVRWPLCLFLILTGFVFVWVALPISPGWIEEYYSLGLYRVVAAVLVPVGDAVTFSITGVVLAFASVTSLFLWGLRWCSLRRAGASHWRGLRWGLVRGVFAALLLYALFVVMWGGGYRRRPLADRIGLESTPPSTAEVNKCAEALARLVTASVPVSIDRDPTAALRAVAEAMPTLVADLEGSDVAVPVVVKRLPAGTLLRWGSAGVTSPYFLEAHVDGGLPDAAFVSVGAHELAHVAGRCGEAEATFVGVAAALRAEHVFARYAAALFFFVEVMAQLPEAEREALRARLPAVALEDITAARATATRYRSAWLSRVQSIFYDCFLRSQGVDDGVADYDRAVSLFVRAWQGGVIDLHYPDGDARSASPVADDF